MHKQAHQKVHTADGGFSFDHGTMFMAPEPGGPAGGGTGGDTGTGGGAPAGGAKFTPPDLSTPEARAWFESQVKVTTEGLVKNRDTILAEKRKLEEDLKKFSGLGDPDTAKAAMAKLRDEEEKKLVAAGDIDGLVKRRLKETEDRFAQTLTAKEQEIANTKKAAEQRMETVRKLTLERELAEAAIKAGVQPTAVPDLLNRGRGVFQVSEDGKVTCVDGNGVAITETNGQPRTPASWVENLKGEAPHFFPPSSGAGSRGNNSTAGGGDSIVLAPGYTQAQFEAATAKAQAEGKTLVLPSARK
jgi:hypothetical protein